MRKILVTGGTTFVSRFVANYFVQKGEEVYVLNRNNRPQVPGAKLIEADRNDLGDKLRGYDFDAVLDITSYTRRDVENLLSALGSVRDYVFISTSAVYHEDLPRPMVEEVVTLPNTLWADYASNKLDAEKYLWEVLPQAYILRPPYFYGPGENLYREPFIFECAEKKRPFYIPGDGTLSLQFFHVEDLCRLIEILLEKKPENRIYNVGNPTSVTVNELVQMCYEIVGTPLETKYVTGHSNLDYFSFRDYYYFLDVTKEMELLGCVKDLRTGLAESYAWYRDHREDVKPKPYLAYIDSHF